MTDQRGSNDIIPIELEALAQRVESPEWQRDATLGHALERAGMCGVYSAHAILYSVDAALSLLPREQHWVVRRSATFARCVVGQPMLENTIIRGHAIGRGLTALSRAIVAAALRIKAKDMT